MTANRQMRLGIRRFAFNYGSETCFFNPNAEGETDYHPLIGEARIGSAGLPVWMRRQSGE